MDNKRRNLIKIGLAVGGASVFAASYSGKVVDVVDGIKDGTSGVKTNSAHNGNSLAPEYVVTNGELEFNAKQRISPSMCFGCWTLCGVRLRIDNANDKILRVSGNPYHPLSQTKQLPFATAVKDGYLSLTGEQGLAGRSTACARGNAMLEMQNSPYRITKPLKRVGKRGEGKWVSISYEQLLKEVIEGGDLFGEGHVDGLRAIRDLKTPIDANNPEYGAKVNQLLMTNASNEGRDDIIKRFAFNSFGTRNFANHGSYCGYSYRAGSGAALGDLQNFSHLKPDWDNVKFVLFIGTSPAQSGNPFKRQARQLAERRIDSDFNYVVVAPSLPVSVTTATQNNRWLPINPGTDSALALAITQWLIANNKYHAQSLELPSKTAMQAVGESSWSNASYLVISQDGHPRFGAFLRASDVGLQHTGDKLSDDDYYVVVDANTKQLVDYRTTNKAELFVNQTVKVVTDATNNSGNVATNNVASDILVQSSLEKLKQSAFSKSMDEFSKICGIASTEIIKLAEQLTSYGRQVAVNTHGGTMHTNGFYTVYALVMLNTLLGSVNVKGGVLARSGGFPSADGRYDFNKFANKMKPKGVFLSRSKFKYENTTEYKNKLSKGEKPYPAQAPWYPFSAPLLTEHLVSAVNGYPYKIKAWINHIDNPIYGVAGLKQLIGDKLKDEKLIPLMISVNSFINETTALSDYIVPDTITYESWGLVSAWHGVPTKNLTVRWPAVTPQTAKTADGRHICLENFLIDIAKAMKLGGFGENAIKDSTGKAHSINSAEDYYLRAIANVAFAKNGVAEASDEDIKYSGVETILPRLKSILPADEVKKVAYVLSRGGRFEDYKQAYKDDKPKYVWEQTLNIWNETVGTNKNSMTGEHYSGTPIHVGQRFADGTLFADKFKDSDWPFKITNFKSNIASAVSVLSPKLSSIKGINPIYINPLDAKNLGIESGDEVVLTTPNGELKAQALIVDGVLPKVIAIEHGFGHTELGVRSHVIDGVAQPKHMAENQGINLNDIGILDTTRSVHGVLLDWVVGSASRQALPAKIRKV